MWISLGRELLWLERISWGFWAAGSPQWCDEVCSDGVRGATALGEVNDAKLRQFDSDSKGPVCYLFINYNFAKACINYVCIPGVLVICYFHKILCDSICKNFQQYILICSDRKQTSHCLRMQERFKPEGGTTKWQRKLWGENTYGHYLDCDHDFIGQNLSNWTI